MENEMEAGIIMCGPIVLRRLKHQSSFRPLRLHLTIIPT